MTAFCGVGHVLGSIVIGFVGIAIGASLHRLQWLEGVRGPAAFGHGWGRAAAGGRRARHWRGPAALSLCGVGIVLGL
ncbi:MAG: hypothetical protein IPF84_02060 [Proteobacteria bacterium]|nr:hypothetical protein [Pseudomonadota bacterium]